MREHLDKTPLKIAYCYRHPDVALVRSDRWIMQGRVRRCPICVASAKELIRRTKLDATLFSGVKR